MPRAPLPATSVTGDSAMSQHRVGGRYPSVLAPTGPCVRPSPSHRLWLSLDRWVFAGCRHSAGPWPFPTLSLHPLRGRLDPYPAASLRCVRPFLPREHRPCIRRHMLGRRNSLCNATSTESLTFRGCRHSLRFKLPRSLGPQVAPTADNIVSGRPGRLHHAYSRVVAHAGCGIATCPIWAIDTAGLPPAGLQSCRLLRLPPG